MNTHPVTAKDKDGDPVNRRGEKCSTHEPPPAGVPGCACSRYSGEGRGLGGTPHAQPPPLNSGIWGPDSRI